MQEKNTVNFDELVERGRKLQSQAVFEAFRRGLMLMKIYPGKKSASSSPSNGTRVTDRTNIVFDAPIAK